MELHAFDGNEFTLSVNAIDFDNSYDFSKIHRHTYYEIFLFETGKGGLHVIDFDSYQVKNKTLYIVAPNQVHLLKRIQGECGIVLQFTTEYLQTSLHTIATNVLFTLKSNPEVVLSESEFQLLFDAFQYLKELHDSQETFKQEKISHYFAFTIFQILSVLQNKSCEEQKHNLTFQFLLLAEKNFPQNRNIGNYAKMLSSSVTKLNAQIKKDLGKTPLQIIHDLLITEIKRLIIIEKLSHKEISFLLNFDSQSSYSRFVNKQLGYNPSELSKTLEIHK